MRDGRRSILPYFVNNRKMAPDNAGPALSPNLHMPSAPRRRRDAGKGARARISVGRLVRDDVPAGRRAGTVIRSVARQSAPSPRRMADPSGGSSRRPLISGFDCPSKSGKDRSACETRRRAHPVLAAHIGRWHSGLLFLAHPDNLRLGEPAFPHVVCSFRWARRDIRAKIFRGQVTPLDQASPASAHISTAQRHQKHSFRWTRGR